MDESKGGSQTSLTGESMPVVCPIREESPSPSEIRVRSRVPTELLGKISSRLYWLAILVLVSAVVIFLSRHFLEPELRVLEKQTTFLRSACPGLDLYHREAAPGIPNHVPVAGICGVSAAVGKVKWNVAPRPSLAVAHNRPPCDSTIERLMANPMPLPWGLVVKNAEKI